MNSVKRVKVNFLTGLGCCQILSERISNIRLFTSGFYISITKDDDITVIGYIFNLCPAINLLVFSAFGIVRKACAALVFFIEKLFAGSTEYAVISCIADLYDLAVFNDSQNAFSPS